jgi:branched-subunit amino acid ABC-type transport system permease component
MLQTFLQTLLDAVAVGSLYALIALGYTMVYGILKFINFAHSDVFVLGAWISFAAAIATGWAASDPASPAPGPAEWVWVGLWALTIAAGLAIAIEFALSLRTGAGGQRFDIRRTRYAATISIMALWAWTAMACLYGAKVAHTSESTRLLSGGLILICSMLACGLVGFALERIAYKPLRKAPRLNVLITAIGVSLLLQNTGQLEHMFGTRPTRMPELMPDVVLNASTVAEGSITPGKDPQTAVLDKNITVEPKRGYRLVVHGKHKPAFAVAIIYAPPGDYPAGAPIATSSIRIPPSDWTTYSLLVDPSVPIHLVDVIGAGTAVLLMLALDALVFRTKMGCAMRAVSFNEKTAALMGIPVDRIISFTFVLGSVLAAAAGFLYAMKYPGLNQTAAPVWVLLGLKAFVAAVVGGIGNVRGAMLGGLLIGLIEFFGAKYLSTDFRDVYVFGLLIVVLLVRPTGILGKPISDKV